MFYLGLILPVCFIPGLTGASIPTQWVLLSCTLGFFLWRPIPFGPAHWLGLLAIAWAAFSTLWSISHWDAMWGLWLMLIWALSFRLGSALDDLTPLFRGLAWGLTINSGFALAQWFGYHPVIALNDTNSGLLYNPTVLGASAALTIIALVEFGLWRHIPGVALGLALCGSRGGWLILIVGLLARRLHWSILLGGLALATFIFAWAPNHSDSQRLYIWSIAIAHLNLWGNSVGSFSSLYYVATDLLFHSPVRLTRPEYVHNDYLQLWFELGIGALPIYAILIIALTRTGARGWPVLLATATLALFYFPLWCPIPAFIGCVVAGRCCANWHRAGAPGLRWRPHLLLRHPLPVALGHLPGRPSLPIQPPLAH